MPEPVVLPVTRLPFPVHQCKCGCKCCRFTESESRNKPLPLLSESFEQLPHLFSKPSITLQVASVTAMSQQESLAPALTPQETAAAARAAARAAAEAATAAAAEAANAAAVAASGITSHPESDPPATGEKPEENDAPDQHTSTEAPINTEVDEAAPSQEEQPEGLTEEKKPDIPVDTAMVPVSAPMHDPNVLNQMSQPPRPNTISPAAALSSVSPGPTTSIQPQPVQPPVTTHVPNLPSVVSPIQKKPANSTPFVCDVVGCGKAFGKKFNLKAHRRVHTGDEPFVCSYPTCGKRFKWKSSLSFHEGLHLNTPDEPHPPATAAELAAAAAAAAAASTPSQPQNSASLDSTAAKKPGKV